MGGFVLSHLLKKSEHKYGLVTEKLLQINRVARGLANISEIILRLYWIYDKYK